MNTIHITGRNFFENPRYFKIDTKAHYRLDHKLKYNKLCKIKDVKTQNENLCLEWSCWTIYYEKQLSSYTFKKYLLVLFLFCGTSEKKSQALELQCRWNNFVNFEPIFFKTPYMIRTHNALVFLPIFVLKPKLFSYYISTKSEFQNQQTYLGVNFKISPLDALLDQLWEPGTFL